MERVVERGNRLAALARVKRNGGSPGVDGMTVEGLPGYLREPWPQSRAARLAGTYQPQPVTRVEIPQPGGGVRTTRGAHRAGPVHPASGAAGAAAGMGHDLFGEQRWGAVRGARRLRRWRKPSGIGGRATAGWSTWTWRSASTGCNHDTRMSLVKKRVADRRVWPRIDRDLQGRGADGRGPGGDGGRDAARGSLSPLLANLLLDGLDKAWERRGHRFVRDADDGTSTSQSVRAGPRVRARVTRCLGAASAVGSQGGQTGGGPAVATDVSGLHVHRASAEPAPGERQGPEGVPGGGTPPDVPHARGVAGTRRGRPAA